MYTSATHLVEEKTSLLNIGLLKKADLLLCVRIGPPTCINWSNYNKEVELCRMFGLCQGCRVQGKNGSCRRPWLSLHAHKHSISPYMYNISAMVQEVHCRKAAFRKSARQQGIHRSGRFAHSTGKRCQYLTYSSWDLVLWAFGHIPVCIPSMQRKWEQEFHWQTKTGRKYFFCSIVICSLVLLPRCGKSWKHRCNEQTKLKLSHIGLITSHAFHAKHECIERCSCSNEVLYLACATPQVAVVEFSCAESAAGAGSGQGRRGLDM